MQEKSTPGKFRELSSTHLGPLTRFYFPPAHFPPMSLHTPLSHQRLRKGKKTSLPMGNTPVLGTATADLVPPSPCLNTVRRKGIGHRSRSSSIIRRAPVASKQLEGVRAAPGPDCHPRLGLPLPGGENTGMAQSTAQELARGSAGAVWVEQSIHTRLFEGSSTPEPSGCHRRERRQQIWLPRLRLVLPFLLQCTELSRCLERHFLAGPVKCVHSCGVLQLFAEISSHVLKYRAFKSFPVLLGSAARVS